LGTTSAQVCTGRNVEIAQRWDDKIEDTDTQTIPGTGFQTHVLLFKTTKADPDLNNQILNLESTSWPHRPKTAGLERGVVGRDTHVREWSDKSQ
jgi:hypothetical protein